MKKLFLGLIAVLGLAIGAQAQFGISAAWVKYDAPEWNNRIAQLDNLEGTPTNFDQNGIQFGLDYWFRLKNKRVEFLPELSFYMLESNVESVAQPDFGYAAQLEANVFQLHFNTQIYPFDFEGDCDCPTFSKDGDVLKKGFFIRVAPGLSYGFFKQTVDNITIAGSNTESLTEKGISPSLRAGVGLDIGLSDFVTVTPIIQYTHTFETGGYTFLNDTADTDPVLSEISQLYFGLRLGLRFDELNKYGYR